ncbi:MAG: C69 family dipeptidase [Anaerovoracaceae bacterium]
MNKKISRKLISVILAVSLVLSGTTLAFGCTGIYFGKDVTDNGTTLAGRSEDSGWMNYKKNYTVRQAASHAPGEMYVGAEKFTIPYPAKTFRYTLVKDYTGEGKEEMAQVGTNEKGVAAEASVSLSRYNNAVKDIDPMVENGLCEEDIPSVVLMQAETARDGAALLIDIYEKIGAGGRDMTMISDKNETWIVQSLSGHSAVAVKAPNDMIGLTPNITGNVDISDKNNTIMTKDFVTTAETAGTIKRDAQGNMLVADSYANPVNMSTNNRLWQGYYYLGGEEFANANTTATSGYINLFKDPRPEKNYTLYEALRLLAYRGEGTSKDGGTGTGNGSGIGNDNTLEAHVFETRHNQPAELAVVQWLSLTPPEFGVYIPGYNALVTDTIAENSIGLETMVYNSLDPSKNSYRTTFYELYFLCKGRDSTTLNPGTREARTKYGSGVQQFWEKYQKELIAQQKAVDSDMQKILAYSYDLALEKATELNKHLQKEALGYAKEMIAELTAYTADDQGKDEYIPTALTEGKLPTNSLAAIGGTGIPSSVAPVGPSMPTSPQKPEITIKDNVGGKVELSADGTIATITPDEGYEVVSVTLDGINVGKGTIVKDLKTGSKLQVVFAKVTADNTAKIIDGVRGTTLKATSALANGGIKVMWQKSKGYRVDGYQVYKSNKKLDGYSKAFTTTKSMYKNTKGLKVAKTYFYRVRGFRTIDGVKYYTQWSNRAYRTYRNAK